MLIQGCCHCGLYIVTPGVSDYFTDRYLVALDDVHVDAVIVDRMVEVTINQKYVNREGRPIEAVYIFPMDEKAAVCSFEAEVDGRRIVGEAQEKHKAERTYQQAISRGDGAYLLEQQTAEIFRAKVGNILEGSEVTIKITYVAELGHDERGRARFLLPTTIAPRYNPNPCFYSHWRGFSAPSSPPTRGWVPYKLSMKMSVEMMTEILSVESTTHPIDCDIRGQSATVSFAQGDVNLNKDVVVVVNYKDPHEPKVVVEEAPDGSLAAMVSLFPKFQLQDSLCEIIFVVDRSGSMGGARINSAANALQLFLRSLPENCYFNIVGFGSRFVCLFQDSKRYSEESMNKASQHASTMRADLGGTELLQPLNHIYNNMPQRPGYSRQIIVLTDGQVSNTDEVCRVVQKNNRNARVFTLGIGESVSHQLVDGMARAGLGTAQFVTSSSDRLEAKVIKQLKDAIQPAITDVTVNWGVSDQLSSSSTPKEQTGSMVRSLLGYVSPNASSTPKARILCHQAPYHVPPIFDNTHFLVYGMFDGAAAHQLPRAVKISAKSPDGPLTVELPLEAEKRIRGKLLHTLAARKMIQDLEEGRSWMHDKTGARESAIENEIVRLGTTFGLASKFTSFVAVEERHHHHCGWYYHPRPVQRHVPQAQSAGFGFRGGSRGRGYNGAPRGGGYNGASRSRGYGGNFQMMKQACPMNAAPPPAPGGGGRCADSFASLMYDVAPVAEKFAMQLDEGAEFEESESDGDDGGLFARLESLGSQPKSGKAAMQKRKKRSKEEKRAGQVEAAPSSSLSAVVLLQNFNGSFSPSNQFYGCLGLTSEKVNERKPTALNDDVWCTILAFVYIEKRFPDQADEWELVVGKARKFAQSRAGTVFNEAVRIAQELIN